jgi:hypothetical protein
VRLYGHASIPCAPRAFALRNCVIFRSFGDTPEASWGLSPQFPVGTFSPRQARRLSRKCADGT